MTNLSNIVEILAKQALGSNSNQHQSQQSGGLGGILGSVLGQLGNNHQQGVQSQQGGLGGILGSVLGQFGRG